MGILPVLADSRDNRIGVTGSAGPDTTVVTFPGAAPTIGFTGTPASGIAPLTVAFTDTSLNTPTGRAWFFGDETYKRVWTQMNASAAWTARYGHSSVAMPDGRIILTGGFNITSGLKNDVWQSTDNGRKWTLVNASAPWMARSFHSSVAMPDGSIVLMGGFDGSPDGLSGGRSQSPPISSVTKGFADASSITNDVWRSTDNGKTWTKLTAGAAWSARSYQSSVVMPDGSIVLMGGADTTGLKNDVWRSTNNGATWTLMNASAGWSARSWFSSVVMPDGSIVLTGGATNSGVTNDVWRSTDNGATWMLMNASAGWMARYGHSSVAMPDGSIVMTGGFNATSGLNNDVWRMVPTGSSAKNPSHTYTTPGTYQVALQAYNADGYKSIRKTDYITVSPRGSPIITSITPTSGYRNTTVSFTIRGTNFQPGFTTVVFRNQSTGVITTTLNSVTLTQIKGDIAIPKNASPGLWNIRVTRTSGSTNTSLNAFTVRKYEVPTFTAIIPAFAFQETTAGYSITGRNFRPGFTTVRFRNATGAVISKNTLTKVTATQINGKLVIPKNAWNGAFSVTITTVDGGSVNRGNAFTLYSLPDPSYPINSNVFTTVVRRVTPGPAPSTVIFPYQVSSYATYGYGKWNYTKGLPYDKRQDLLPEDYDNTSVTHAARLLNFFTMSDIHITDEESPVSAIFFGYKGGTSSAYSPVMLYTTQVLDAAVQTINVLHLKKPFDFGLSLGDVDNSDQYNELRWYIDVLDGKTITPDSGVKDDPVPGPLNDYQDTFKAAGLNKTIKWYQTLGNHDHFYTGFLAPNDYFRQTLVGENIINLGMVFNDPLGMNGRGIYMGSINGTTPYGDIIGIGPVKDFTSPPKVLAADPDRRSLSVTDWISAFLNTSSSPQGHGFNQTNADSGFACYSFEPKADIPIKVIVLDDTQSDDDPIDPGSLGMGHATLDNKRYTWLVNELDEGQAENKLMIIAAHIPIGVLPAGDMAGWSRFAPVTEAQLITKLRTYPNLLLWVAGHRHVNQVTPFNSTDPAHPELGFWEVETSSLRDYTQQFRTFEIVRNSDNTISIFATDVDPSVRSGSLAAKSRSYSVAIQQIENNQLSPEPNGTYNAELVKELSPEMQVIIHDAGTPI